jgi:hypothetical protein
LQRGAAGVFELLARRSSGWWPTTPRPRTSSTWLLASVMIQWREISCAATVPVFLIVIEYVTRNSCAPGPTAPAGTAF